MVDLGKLRPTASYDSSNEVNNSLVIDVNDAAFNEPVAAVNEHLKRLGVQYFVDQANETSDQNGMRTKLVGDAQSSQEEAILMPGTFANGIWPHIVARAEAVRYMAEEAGVRSSTGEPLPVLMTAAPSLASGFNLSRDERRVVAAGNYAPVAERHVRLMDSLGFSAFMGVYYSQAAAYAERISALGSKTKDVGNVIVGEPPHANRQSLLKSLVNFAKEGSQFKAQVDDEAIEVIDELFATKQVGDGFEKGIIAARKDNFALVRGFGRGMLVGDLRRLAESSTDQKITLLHASESTVTPAERTRIVYKVAGLAAATEVEDEAINRTRPSLINNLKRVEITGTNHSFADRVGRFATLVAANLAD